MAWIIVCVLILFLAFLAGWLCGYDYCETTAARHRYIDNDGIIYRLTKVDMHKEN